MTGRQETDKKYQEKTLRAVKGMPKWMENFYYYMEDKTEVFKYTSMLYVKRYLDYLVEEGIDINDPAFLQRITESSIKKYLNIKLGNLSTGSLGNHVVALKKVFEYIKAERYISINPMENMSRPKDKAEHGIVYLEPDEIQEMFQNINRTKTDPFFRSRDILLVSLMLELGLRRGSVSELNVSDIDLSARKIHLITKGQYERTLSFGEKLFQRFETYLEARRNFLAWGGKDSEALFLTKNRTRLNGNSINLIIRQYAKTIDKPITAHKLRATCATNVYNATEDIYLTASLLGHKNVKTTARYAKVSEDKLKKATEILETLL